MTADNDQKFCDGKARNVVAIWEKIVDVQQHFNDILIKVRSFAITIFGAAIGASGLAIKYNMTINVGCLSLQLAAVLIGASLISWFAILVMDRYWYHELLIGAVNHGMAVEESISAEYPQIGLASAITKHFPSTKRVFWLFYGVGFFLHFVLLIGIFFAHGGVTEEQSSLLDGTDYTYSGLMCFG